MATEGMENPVLNSPFEEPKAHFEIGTHGPTGDVLEGRRPSESFIPVPTPKKRKKTGEQGQLDFDATGERIEKNALINDVRREVELWRARDYPGVTPYSRKLLSYWSAGPPTRDEPVFFCQREAAETAIYLAEVAGRHHGASDYRPRLDQANKIHNDGLPRLGLKMATGSGKTVVMAMLIAWQAINKAYLPRDARFSRRFLVVTPGITIRDRLRVLLPSDDGNYYRERDLVPPDLWAALLQAQVMITNYHAFLLRDVKEISGVAANTRKMLITGQKTDPFKETPDQMVARVLGDRTGHGRGEVVVFNDEAHHCYQNKPLTEAEDAEQEDEERNADARVWFRGLQAVQQRVGVKSIYDLSATPYYLKGSGYNEGFIFPWVVSDFSLMDAIESGIVKVPRVPVDDDAAGDLVTYLRLWEHVGKRLPTRNTRALRQRLVSGTWVPPEVLEGALRSLYRSYEKSFTHWEAELGENGEPPPVFIVVCPNTLVSKLVYDWLAGSEVEAPDGTSMPRPGELALLSNVADGEWLAKPRTILIDSAQLESGEALSDDFKNAAAREIDTFKAEYRQRYPGADTEKLTDEDLLREVMNTVGKPGKLGEHVRCVVSVSMLTEGWDANTVSHILGIRAFGSQLLCEQVVGRGLRRRSYAINLEGRLDPEYAEVYGVPFAFIPSDRPVKDPLPKRPAVVVEAVEERQPLCITFPKLDGYRIEIPDAELFAAFDDKTARLHVDRHVVATWTQTEGIAGETAEQNLERLRGARPQEVAYRVARTMLQRADQFAGHDAAEKPWLFPQLVDITRQWLASDCVTFADGTAVGMLLLTEATHRAAEAVFRAIRYVEDARPEVIQPLLRHFDPEGTTDDVSFSTRKAVMEAEKSHVSHVVLDGPRGNTWEERLAVLLEADSRVRSFVKNDHLGFVIPYVHKGRSHEYVPDFLVRLMVEPDDVVRTLIVEVSGGRKDADAAKAKADTARHQWCPAVNNHGGWGRWGFIEVSDIDTAASVLDGAIQSLYADGPVTGLRDSI
ncbi:MAG: restriction endonuclease [Acidimicrobiia bacterium]|nr:restriction endonuclease [Acidimicrobiia bacterium]MYB73942.1 restriction endonuclease [Acidimicrobiia bacterium]MYH99878.1 restriction endonuclease [Acidimicrobiia bacterium]